MEFFLYKLTRPEIEEYLKKDDVVLFPVGSTEQHGKHMAIDNDAFTALEIARRVAEKTGVLVAPVMPFGYSVHHMNFAGSITLGCSLRSLIEWETYVLSLPTLLAISETLTPISLRAE